MPRVADTTAFEQRLAGLPVTRYHAGENEVAPPDMAREYEDFLKNARTEVMSDPESVRLMRATHIKEPA